MRAVALVVSVMSVAMIAATPADAAKKRYVRMKNPAAQSTTVQNSNEQSWRFFRDSGPVWLPSAAKFIYFSDPANKAKYMRVPD